MRRRKFMMNSGILLGSAMALPASLSAFSDATNPPLNSDSWESVRSQFDINHDHIQMAQMLLASHPTPVREAINKHRKGFDESPAEYWEEHWLEQEALVTKEAARYMNAGVGEIALTDSTTQGLAMLYNGLKLKAGDEIVTTTHDHYVTEMSLHYASEKNGAVIKRIDEYADASKLTIDEVVSNITKAISDKTRIVAVTWVQSCTGVKLPIRAIADSIREINSKRDKRIYFCVDGVHGFGNQDEDIPALGCDFFCAGTHKWIFGPRGTGLVWARKNAWDMVAPTIPAFRWNPFVKWLEQPLEGEMTFGDLFSPGGFHAYDHRWSLDTAFQFQMEIGRSRIHQRTSAMSTAVKEAIGEMSHVQLITPIDTELSAGINCFRVKGLTADEVVKKFHEKGVIASASPYQDSVPRLTPCVINTEEEVVKSLKVLNEIN
ncbi:MAG: selenocysteine lyase/cysteine desulfurase [Cyclobacteriaceae bacterium]|jgi:selenocysteine lyase/cysteine desulfurase